MTPPAAPAASRPFAAWTLTQLEAGIVRNSVAHLATSYQDSIDATLAALKAERTRRWTQPDTTLPAWVAERIGA